nr:reverse transcriptase domain-containing protein [Tanacetum cinerariifolium]
DATHSTKAWMNFMVVKSLSPYNNIIGQPGLKAIQAVPFTVHGMLKFPFEGGIVTICSTILIPVECTSVITSPIIPREEKTRPANFKIALHPDFPDQEVVIGGTLFDKGRTELCSILRKNLDVFAWQPSDMTGVPRSVAEHRLNIQEGYSPVRQKKRGQAPERANAIQAEVQKLVEAGIMREVYYHDWLSNPVMIKKHDGSWRMCVDFTDLNKAYAYKGYHQIQLAEADEEKTTFHTGQGVYCYTKMPFGLKNTGATYQRLMDKAFEGQIGRNIEVYVDDLVVKSHTEAEMMRDVEETFRTLRKVSQAVSAAEAQEEPWTLFTDGSSCVDGSGAWLILTSPQGTEFTYALRFYFTASNNEAEYEALVAGLQIAAQMGVKNVQVSVDSKLVANQVLGTYVAKEDNMIKYLEIVKGLVSGFTTFSIGQVRRSKNKKADALSKIASTSFAHLSKQVLVEVLENKSIKEKEVATVIEEDGPTWMTQLVDYLKEGILPGDKKEARTLRLKARQYELMEGVLYRRSFLTPWLRCVRPLQAEYVTREIHEGSCSMHAGRRLHLTPITAPWPFYKWGIDIAGPFSEGPRKVKILIVAMDYFTKWIEAKALATITGGQERRERSAICEAKAKSKMMKYYNARVRGVAFKPGEFVYSINDASHAVAGGKLGPKWEGPYEDGCHLVRGRGRIPPNAIPSPWTLSKTRTTASFGWTRECSRPSWTGEQMLPKTGCRLRTHMDLFNLIRASNPTKVKIRSRPRAAHEVPLLTLTANRVVEMNDPATATDSSGVPSTIERPPLDFAYEAGTSDQGTMAPVMPPPEDVPATDAPRAGQAEEVAATDPPAATESRKRGRDGAEELGLASTRPVPVPENAPAGVSDPDPLSFADPQSRHPADIAQSSQGTAASGDPDSENASSPFAVGSPESIYRPEWGVANGSLLDTPEACQDLVDDVAPPGYFSEPRHLHNDEFLRKYNVNLARQVAMGSQLRMRFEQQAKLLRKSVAQVARRDKRIQARELEIKNLEALLEAEADPKKAAEDRKQVSGEEKLKAAFEEFKRYEDNRVEQRCAEMDARLDALSIDFDEELYPHMLTAIAGRRWVIGRGLRLALMKCGESLELRQAFADVVSAGIAKGMNEGFRRGVEHGQAQLSLESIEAYDPEAEAKHVAALQALKDLKYPLVDQLEGLKDAPMDVIMAALHSRSDTGDDAPQYIRDLRPSSSQLTIFVYPDGLAILLADATTQKKLEEAT